MSPLLEPVNPEMLKNYPYFINWLQDLHRLPEDVFDFAVCGEVKEVPSDTEFKKFEPIGNYIASMIFKDGEGVERSGKFGDGKMIYVPVRVKSS